MILYVLLCMHFLSYIIHEYGIKDIKAFGRPNINGVYRARNETFLKTIETFFICMVAGFILNHLIELKLGF